MVNKLSTHTIHFKATHARHDTQDVVGHSVHEELAVVTALVVETR